MQRNIAKNKLHKKGFAHLGFGLEYKASFKNQVEFSLPKKQISWNSKYYRHLRTQASSLHTCHSGDVYSFKNIIFLLFIPNIFRVLLQQQRYQCRLSWLKFQFLTSCAQKKNSAPFVLEFREAFVSCERWLIRAFIC